jgi:hypothetical protein
MPVRLGVAVVGDDLELLVALVGPRLARWIVRLPI